jgi:hypothetical protein
MAFHLIANDQFPTNPLIIMVEMRYGEIFKVRNPIRNLHDKLAPQTPVSVNIEYKDLEMNQGGE